MNTSINISNKLPVFEYCDDSSWTNFIEEKHDNGFLIESVILDLIGGIVLSGCAFQFYRGIEISHPVYSVVFSNILFCVVSSFISFIAMLYSYIGKSCDIFWLLGLYNNSNSVVVNIVSWTTIAFQRYHILIATKSEDEGADLDLPRIQKISLLTNWAIIIIIYILRGILGLPSLRDEIYSSEDTSFLINVVTIAVMPIFVVTTLAVYYKIDVTLKILLESQQHKLQHGLGTPNNSGKSCSVALHCLHRTLETS